MTADQPQERRSDELDLERIGQIRNVATIGHRKGCPTGDEPGHHACWVAGSGAIERVVVPSYEALLVEVERLQAQVAQLTHERDHYAERNDHLRARCAQLEQAARVVLDGWDDQLPTREEMEALRAALDQPATGAE